MTSGQVVGAVFEGYDEYSFQEKANEKKCVVMKGK